MAVLFNYLKSLWLIASIIVYVVWAGLLVVGIARWVNGSFAPITSTSDFLYRSAFVIFGIPLLALLGSAFCDLIERVKCKMRISLR